MAVFLVLKKISSKLPSIRRLNTQIIISHSEINYNGFRINCIGEFNMELNYALIGARIKKIRKSQNIT